MSRVGIPWSRPIFPIKRGCYTQVVCSKFGLRIVMKMERKMIEKFRKRQRKEGKKNIKEERKEKGKHMMLVLKSDCLCVEHII